MSTITRNFGKQSVHDLVISLVAQRWTNPLKYNITTNPGSEKNRWVGSDKNYPDVICWVKEFNRQRAQWIAEVETEESVTQAKARGQWRDYAAIGVPFYLIVPKGYRMSAQVYAVMAGVRVAGIYEFAFINRGFQLTREV